MRVLKGWCCKDADSLWEEEDIPPPCHVCPKQNNQLSELNQRLIRCYRMLDVTGRDRMFEAGFLREEAIDCALSRYGINTPILYERLIYIDVHFAEQRKKQVDSARERKK